MSLLLSQALVATLLSSQLGTERTVHTETQWSSFPCLTPCFPHVKAVMTVCWGPVACGWCSSFPLTCVNNTTYPIRPLQEIYSCRCWIANSVRSPCRRLGCSGGLGGFAEAWPCCRLLSWAPAAQACGHCIPGHLFLCYPAVWIQGERGVSRAEGCETLLWRSVRLALPLGSWGILQGCIPSFNR